MKSSDITDETIYELVARARFSQSGRRAPLLVYDACEALSEYPEKVVLAKLRRMVSRGRLRGCPCGCRGDYRFPWEEFGDDYEGREQWRERMAEYFASGIRVYGY